MLMMRKKEWKGRVIKPVSSTPKLNEKFKLHFRQDISLCGFTLGNEEERPAHAQGGVDIDLAILTLTHSRLGIPLRRWHSIMESSHSLWVYKSPPFHKEVSLW